MVCSHWCPASIALRHRDQAPSVNTEIDSQYYNEIVHSTWKQTWQTLARWALIHLAILHVKMTIYKQRCDTYVVFKFVNFFIGFTFINGLWHPLPSSSLCDEFNMKAHGGRPSALNKNLNSRLSFGKAALSHVLLAQGNNLLVLAYVSVGGWLSWTLTWKWALTLYTLRSKFEFSFVAPIHFLQKKWGEVDKISSKFFLCDNVHNSHDHSVLQSHLLA